jgi:probable HAF family extracellular repeat protein
MGLNNLGQVCGTTSGYQAFLWSNGTRSYLGTLGSTSFADGINDLGQVVGYSYNGDVLRPAMYYNGTVTDMGSFSIYQNYALAINNSGEAVGYTVIAQGSFPYYATSWQGGTVHNLGVLPHHGGFSIANDLNSAGTVVGMSGNFAFVYTTATGMKPLTNFPSTFVSEAYSVNDAGVIVGKAGADSLGNYYHAVVWNNGTISDLGILGISTGFGSQANSVNDLGQIVGSSDTTNGLQHAFIYDATNGMRDLNLFIDPSLGLTLTSALQINDSSQILADASNGDSYLLTLVPEPSAAILIIIGLVPLVVLRTATARRRSV